MCVAHHASAQQDTPVHQQIGMLPTYHLAPIADSCLRIITGTHGVRRHTCKSYQNLNKRSIAHQETSSGLDLPDHTIFHRATTPPQITDILWHHPTSATPTNILMPALLRL